jgi:hypothetical protein
MIEVVTRPLLDVIRALDTHWFFFCCGALVNVPSSVDMVKSFANEYVVSLFDPLSLKIAV